MDADRIVSPETLAVLEEHAAQADVESAWPAMSWDALRQGGVLRWIIPAAHEGDGRAASDLLRGYEAIAGACLTTCFILSQRDGACRRIRDSGNEALCRELLPALARGDRFATVGLSQLTTSRQHVKPALTAQLTSRSLRLNGSIPWVTGSPHADHFIIGAVLDDGRQILAAIPAQLTGVLVGKPLPLMALEGSLTAEVRCDDVEVDRKWVLAGPAERVMPAGKGGAGGLETSCLAVGLAGASVKYLRKEAAARPDLRPCTEKLEVALEDTRAEMYRIATEGHTADTTAALRAKANALVLLATQTALTAAKGTGFVRDHPAQRWARQALFFLVWSCPAPVARATMESLSCDL